MKEGPMAKIIITAGDLLLHAELYDTPINTVIRVENYPG